MAEDNLSPASTVRAKTIQVSVKAGSAREFPISVFPGCFVEYSFYTKGGDIGFGILLEKPEGKLIPVLDRDNVNSHEEAVTGKIKCTQGGTLWFQWDNTHAWFTSKDLVYSVTRQPEDGVNDASVSKLQSPENVSAAAAQNGVSPASNTNGTSLSSSQSEIKVILGTMTMSSQVNPTDSVKMLQMFSAIAESGKPLELDTALMYNHGKTEILLGEIWNVNPAFKTMFSLATKANPFKNYNENLRPENVKRQLNQSLKNLQKSSVDLFYLHAPDHETNIELTLKAVNELYLEGKFRRFGLSNYAAWEVMEIWYLCDKNNWIKPTVYQGMYNAVTRQVEKELFPCLRRLNIAFYAYNPLAGGLLTDRYVKQGSNAKAELMTNLPTQGRFGVKGMKTIYRDRFWKEEYFTGIQAVQGSCLKHKIPLAQASLRWLKYHSQLQANCHDGIILGASKLRHLEENLYALKVPDGTTEVGSLPQEILKAFDTAWDLCKGNSPSYNR